jgi:hypothetical protein
VLEFCGFPLLIVMSVTILTGFDKAKWFYDSFLVPFIHYSGITPCLGFVSVRQWKLADRTLNKLLILFALLPDFIPRCTLTRTKIHRPEIF